MDGRRSLPVFDSSSQLRGTIPGKVSGGIVRTVLRMSGPNVDRSIARPDVSIEFHGEPLQHDAEIGVV
jgi:hypothetical protein